MTTTAAGNAERVVSKEKAEKRRALGRGLESLLPGPRVVVPARDTASGSAGRGDGGGQQIPSDTASHSGAAPLRAGSHVVRNENGVGDRNDKVDGVAFDGVIRAVVEEEESGASGAAVENGELRSPGRTNASAPTPAQTGRAQEDGITIMAQADSRVPSNLVINLGLADIDKNPFQTRYVQNDEKLEELAESIKAQGVVQPIVVRPAKEEGRYILILGERRMHASKMAGRETIPAVVRRVSEQQAAEMTIIENLQREDLSPLEQAEAFRVLSEEFEMTQVEIGQRVGLSRESVANYMRLLRLPREVMQLLAEKRIKFNEAKELLKLDNADQISKAALYAVKKGMNLEQIERLVLSMNGWLDPIPGMPVVEKKKSGARWVDPNVRAQQTELERLLGVRVRIRDRKGKGRIVIEYSTVDDYERVVGMLRGKS